MTAAARWSAPREMLDGERVVAIRERWSEDAALRAALIKFYPHLEAIRLTDYKVRIVNSSAGTAAKTRVFRSS